MLASLFWLLTAARIWAGMFTIIAIRVAFAFTLTARIIFAQTTRSYGASSIKLSSFYKYEAALKSWVDGQYENWPISGSYIRRVVGKKWMPEFTGQAANFEEASLAMMPRVVYESS